MVSIDKLVEIAKEEATKSDHAQKMGAVIFKKKTVVSKSRNYKFAYSSKIHPRFMRYPGSMHAEGSAILSAKSGLAGACILVVRVNNKGNLLLAKPCSHCMTYLSYVGIKRAYYSTSEGSIKIIKIPPMLEAPHNDRKTYGQSSK